MESAEYALMDKAEDAMWWYRALHTRLRDALAGTMEPILDAGCGTGGLLTFLGTGARFGVEWSEAAASRAAAKSAAPVARGSVNALPFANASFGAVVAADVLCHGAVDPAQALAEMKRVLRPGGRLIVNMPAYQWMLSAHDTRVHNTRRMTTTQTQAMLAGAGFQAIRARYWNTLLLPLMIAQRKILSRGDSASDVAPFPPWLDATLLAVTSLERCLKFPLPFGGSVLAIAEKP